MFCPNCGAQLEIANQNFCQKCGSEIPGFSKSSELEQRSSPSPDNRNVHQLQQKSVKISDSRPLSKRCLGFGIVSLIIAVITFNIGSTFMPGVVIFYFVSMQYLFISVGIFHLVGILIGIVSRNYSKQAKSSEPQNTALKAGSILGLIGLILNIILMIAAFSLAAVFILT
ncbi:MAG: zinc-ribbon domain-containing protein [Promethearchaeota archaeon]|jgi:hypothetical protein